MGSLKGGDFGRVELGVKGGEVWGRESGGVEGAGCWSGGMR